MDKKECRTCVHLGTRQGVGKIGNCKRYPKVPVVIQRGQNVEWIYPPVKPTDWCGEYSRHPDLIKPNKQKYAAPGGF